MDLRRNVPSPASIYRRLRAKTRSAFNIFCTKLIPPFRPIFAKPIIFLYLAARKYILFILGNFRNEITAKLKIPDFLNNALIQNLQDVIGLRGSDNKNGNNTLSGLWSNLNVLQFKNYIQTKKNDIEEGLNKIAEVTSKTY